jgi:hypothetical protein
MLTVVPSFLSFPSLLSLLSSPLFSIPQGDSLVAVDDIPVDTESLKRVGELIAGPVSARFRRCTRSHHTLVANRRAEP